MDGDRATVHAPDTADPATEVEPRAHPPRGGAEPGDQLRRRRHHGAAGPRGRARLGSGRHPQRGGAAGRVYGPPTPPTHHRAVPDGAYLHAERRKPGVTLELLHLEYLEQHPDGYRYTQFCEVYRRWLQRRGLSMRQVHRAGEKCFVDYAGQKPKIIEPTTGEVIEVELFVAVLGASNYTYAEATRTQQVPDWVASHQRAFQFFGGVTAAIVPDQLKSGVVVPCRYEPGVQRTYDEFARHYGTVILPARPAKPRDKAKIEVAVQVAERWILARLRHETFFSLAALNARIAELLADLNARPMRLYRASRRDLFERLDQPALRALPAETFVYSEWKVGARVNIDYHIELHGHYYSVPYALIHEHVDARLTATTVEIFHRGQRVAAHRRSVSRGQPTTDPGHMPKAHQRHLEWTERHGYELWLAKDRNGWRSTFLHRSHVMQPWVGQVLYWWPTPWRAVQEAAWRALNTPFAHDYSVVNESPP